MKFIRSKHNPILKPDKKNAWQSLMVYNPAALYENGVYHLFYRAMGQNWISRIGHAVSKNGIKFKCEKEPLLKPELPLEKNGLEDPRITKINKTYYLTYTAYDGKCARLCLATSKNLKTWERHGEMIPNWDFIRAKGFILPWDPAQQTKEAKESWSKAGGIFPGLINGKFMMLFGDRNIWLAESTDGIRWAPVWKPFLRPRKKYFDKALIEMGPPPIKTEKGWLVLYHGAENFQGRITYRLGYALLDLENPAKIIYRHKEPIFEPKNFYPMRSLINILPGGLKGLRAMNPKELNNFIKDTETSHKLPRVILCCGAVLTGNILRIYYGVGDTVVCTAKIGLGDLLG